MHRLLSALQFGRTQKQPAPPPVSRDQYRANLQATIQANDAQWAGHR